MSKLKDKKVIVVGLAASGLAAARALKEAGALVRVTEADTSPAIQERATVLGAEGIEVETGGHDLGSLDADLAIVSPGVPPGAPVVQELRARGIPIRSEIELAYQISKCSFLAVTGTNGKTTTTSLLARMLQEQGFQAVAAGNIGLPLVEAVASLPRDGVVVVEASSFQLATIETFRPRVAVLLNIGEDHIDWHETPAAYAAAKARIALNQRAEDAFVFNADDPACVAVAATVSSTIVPFSATRGMVDGIGVEGATVLWRGRDVFTADDVMLPGRPGLEDALAAAAAALSFGAEMDAVVRALRGFRPLSHRFERVAELGGITYIDDSKATNPHATIAAVAGLKDVVLIAGGRSKGVDLSALAATAPPVAGVVALGEASADLERVFGGLVPVRMASSMREAVAEASMMAVSGGSVLLSPGCASLDMYESYAHRGDEFARAVRELVALSGRED